MVDLHIHSSRCGHARGSMREYVDAGRDAGLRVMAFTDHLPLPDGFPEGYAMTWSELPAYVEDVARARRKSAEEGGPEVLLGIEADWIPGHELLVGGALRAHAFDVVLGSVHFIDGWAFDDPDQMDGYRAWSTDALWARYFEDVATAASTGLFDVMAHPDLVKKLGSRSVCDPTAWYEELASVFAECGVAIEVNTGGLRYACAEVYPAMDLLRACRQRGVPVTMGSDAHTPSDVGSRLHEARTILKEAGYHEVLVWRQRVPESVPL
jgi:histidinol-phosphatase (PHP family)